MIYPNNVVHILLFLLLILLPLSENYNSVIKWFNTSRLNANFSKTLSLYSCLKTCKNTQTTNFKFSGRSPWQQTHVRTSDQQFRSETVENHLRCSPKSRVWFWSISILFVLLFWYVLLHFGCHSVHSFKASNRGDNCQIEL